MYRLLTRRQIHVLLVALFVVFPVSASIACYASGIRCPLCFSARITRVYRCCVIRKCPDGQVRAEFCTPLGWECDRCGLNWKAFRPF
jgi:hypothetical protein